MSFKKSNDTLSRINLSILIFDTNWGKNLHKLLHLLLQLNASKWEKKTEEALSTIIWLPPCFPGHVFGVGQNPLNSQSPFSVRRWNKMTKFIELDWKIPVPKELVEGAIADRWTEVILGQETSCFPF